MDEWFNFWKIIQGVFMLPFEDIMLKRILFFLVVLINISWIVISYICYFKKNKESIFFSFEDFKNFISIIKKEEVTLKKVLYKMILYMFYASAISVLIILIYLIYLL